MAKLKIVLDKLDEVPEALREFYTKGQDGKFRLDTPDGLVPADELEAVNDKLTEFRDNNRRLHKENDTLKKQYDGVDADAAKAAVAELAKLKASGINKSEDIATAVAQAVEKATEPLLTRVKGIETERDQAKAQLTERQRDDALWDVGAKAGIREAAKEDFLHRGRKVWRFDEKSKLVAMDGDTPLYSKRRGKVTEPLSIEEWVVELLPQSAEHLFKASGGSGGRNDGGKPGETGRVIANDPLAIGQNLDAIAKGEASVSGTAS